MRILAPKRTKSYRGGIARQIDQTRYDRSFVVFLGLMVVVAVVTAIAFVIFGPPEITSIAPD